MAHWTNESSHAFIHRVTFDFWTQIQKRLEVLPLTQFELAQMFNVSESAVSQTLNNSRNPTLKTLFNYAQAAKLKFAILAYEDTDPTNSPVNSEIFTICWEKAGRPRTFGQASAVRSVEAAFNYDSLIIPTYKTKSVRNYQLKKDQTATNHWFNRQLPLVFVGGGARMNSDAEMLTAATDVKGAKAA
ncbi:MAG: helix-turn-helix domain-containing protein [Pyrinomonadaceae bacterium]